MPKYIMKDPDSVEHEVWCSIAEMQAKKVLGWTLVFQPNKNSLIGHTDSILGHTSQGWRDVLRNIRDKNPGSDIDTG